MSEYITMWKRCSDFSGRSTRKEYWMAYLINIIVLFILYCLPENGGIITSLYLLVIPLPSLALFVRRLHDTNRSGLCFLLVFIPFVGFIVLLVFLCTDSIDENNNYES